MSLSKIRLILYIVYKLIIEWFNNVINIRKVCKSTARLDEKVVVITGGNAGVGKETAYQLSLRGAKIIIGCRDVKKGENAIKEIKDWNPNANITLLKLDLSSLASVRQFAKEVKDREEKIDILINNAGVAFGPESKTVDGYETILATNYLGHFLLTLLLLDLLKSADKSRIINVSSAWYMLGEINFNNINLRGEYSEMKAYSQSKLAIILFTRELTKRLGINSNITTYSLHPGFVDTRMTRESPISFMKFIFIPVEMGVQTTLYCALEESLDNESGFYYDHCSRVDDLLPNATNDKTAKQLWELSCDLVKINGNII